MNLLTHSLMESSSPERLIVNEYKVALKFFLNKDFARSFAIIDKLHDTCYEHYVQGTLSEKYFVRIVTLYLTVLSLLVNPKDGNGNQLSKADRKNLIQKLEKGEVLDKLYQTFGHISKIPLELLFQVFLVNYTCQNVTSKEHSPIVRQFKKVYSLLDFSDASEDRALKKWVDMYIYNVLPDADDFATAFKIAEENPLLNTERAKGKLEELQEVKKQEKKIREKKAQELQSKEAKRLEEEKAKQRKMKDESDLKFKSLRQIRQEREQDDRRANEPRPNNRNTQLTIEQIKSRVEHLLRLSSSVIQKNSPVILVALILAFIGSRFLRNRRIKIKEKLAETLKMAFKVTYL